MKLMENEFKRFSEVEIEGGMQKPITNEKVARMEKLSDEIATLSANINVANYRLLTLIHEFDEGKGWGYQNARSCAHWLSWRVGFDLPTARE